MLVNCMYVFDICLLLMVFTPPLSVTPLVMLYPATSYLPRL